MQKRYIKDWWKMIGKRHGLKWANVLWVISLLLFILTIIGVITMTGSWRLASIVALVMVVLVYFWHFFIEIPSEMFEQVKESVRSLKMLEDSQKREFLDTSHAPQTYLNIWIKRIILYKPQARTGTPYANIEMYISNGSIFTISDFEIECNKTRINLNNQGEELLGSKPFVGEGKPNKLNAGCLNYQVTIEQPLTLDMLEALCKPSEHVLTRWKFDLKLQFAYDGQKKEAQYFPEWEGFHGRIQEIYDTK